MIGYKFDGFHVVVVVKPVSLENVEPVYSFILPTSKPSGCLHFNAIDSSSESGEHLYLLDYRMCTQGGR